MTTSSHHINGPLVHMSIFRVVRGSLSILPHRNPSWRVAGGHIGHRQQNGTQQLLGVVVGLVVGVAHGLLGAFLGVAVQGSLWHDGLQFVQLLLVHWRNHTINTEDLTPQCS